MSVREALNATPRRSLAIVVTGTVVAVGFAVWSLRSESPPGVPATAFYSSDDGATFFEDDAEKLSFVKDGKPVVMAHVFEGSKRGKFVGYLERMSPLGAGVRAAAGADREVKRPGDREWVSASSEAGMRVMSVRAPDSQPVVRVDP